MIRGLLKLIAAAFFLAVVAYGIFMIPLGERSLYEHLRRIAKTEEAQELGRGVEQVGREMSDRMNDQMQDTDAGEPEGTNEEGVDDEEAPSD